MKKAIWLDVDPGHDDAIAILLAVHSPEVNLLGVSTVYGNSTADCTAVNAARCLRAYGAPETIQVYPGATKPLLRPVKHDPEIHGLDGLGGAAGLPSADDPDVQAVFARGREGKITRALEGMSDMIWATWKGGQKVSVISSGPMTNIALFISVYPDLLECIEEFVFMGGGVGIGNRSAVAEYNVLCDPEAAQIVLNAPVKKTMIPLNVTHTAIVTKMIHARLLCPSKQLSQAGHLPQASTNLRYMLSSIITYFTDSYKSTFGFKDGPPIHDALTIAYVARPELFTSQRHRVDIELHGTFTSGETVVDMWQYQHCDDSWGVGGKNCLVAESIQVEHFFDFFLGCVSRCDEVSPLNRNIRLDALRTIVYA